MEVTLNIKEENSSDFCLVFVQESGLCISPPMDSTVQAVPRTKQTFSRTAECPVHCTVYLLGLRSTEVVFVFMYIGGIV